MANTPPRRAPAESGAAPMPEQNQGDGQRRPRGPLRIGRSLQLDARAARRPVGVLHQVRPAAVTAKRSRKARRRQSCQRRRGEASLASCEVMSAKVTSSEVITSITVGLREASASRNAGPSAAGS